MSKNYNILDSQCPVGYPIFYRKELNVMYDWMKKGVTIVPNVLLDKYSELNISSDEFLMIVYLLSKLNKGEELEELESVQKQFGWDHQQLSSVLNGLYTKKYIDIELIPGKDGKQRDHYSLRSLFNKVNDLYFDNQRSSQTSNLDSSQRLIGHFEEEFGRVLTQMELSKISTWVNEDKIDPDLIKVALREAVIHQALSFQYIDTILLNWRKKNIQTVAQAEKEIQRFRQKMQTNHDNKQVYNTVEIPIVDWAKDGR